MEHNIKRVQAYPPKFAQSENLKPHQMKHATGSLTSSLFQSNQQMQSSVINKPQPIAAVSVNPQPFKQVPVKPSPSGSSPCQIKKVRDSAVAFDPVSNTMMNNTQLFERYREMSEQMKSEENPVLNQTEVKSMTLSEMGTPGKGVMFTAIITREVKKKYDQAYKNYKENLCDTSEIEVANVKEQMISQVTEYFKSIRSQVQTLRTQVNQRITQSTCLKELETLLEQNQEYFKEDCGADLAKEKAKFDQKLERGRYAGIVKRQQYYRELIATLDSATQHMRSMVDQADQCLGRVVKIDENAEEKAESITKKIIDDTIMIDLDDKQLESVNQTNQAEPSLAQGMTTEDVQEIDAVDTLELSMFSTNIPANRCYFQSMRNIENKHVFLLRNRQFSVYDAAQKTSKVVGMCDKYNTSMVLLPGKGECMVVGGSNDAESKSPVDKVIVFNSEGKMVQRKPISQPRSQIGLCVGSLKSEQNAQYHKTYVFAFGGVGGNGQSSKVAEKYNVRANIWQTLPDLKIARAKPSGCVIGDFLYVFAGNGGQGSIERLNLKLNMARTGDKFETIETKLPFDAADVGIIPQLNANEILLVGGFKDGKCLNQVSKFSAVPNSADDSSQPLIEYSVEEVPREENTKVEMKPDFFGCNSMILTDHENDNIVTIFGASYKHTFVGQHIAQCDPLV